MSIKLKKAIKLINQIQKIRSKNNKNWMDIVKLALQLDFNSTTKILNQIYKEDSRIGKITKKIKNLSK